MAELKNITTNRFVTFVDILGFKNLVDSSSHAKVLEKLNSLRNALDHIEAEKLAKLKTWIFSDSILIVSDDDSYQAADAILHNTSKLVVHALEKGLLVKGVIAHGKFTADFDRSIFFGAPLIDAYILEEEVKLSSIILHHTFEKKIKKFKEDIKLYHGGRCLEYLTPLQKGFVNHLHLNWMEYGVLHLLKNNDEKNIQIDKFVNMIKEIYLSVSGSSRIYIDNTLKYFEACRIITLAEGNFNNL